MTHLPDQEYSTGCVSREVQLLGTDVNITGQNIVHDDVLNKGSPVMLFLIEDLGIVQGDICQLTEASGCIIITGAEHGILVIIGIANNSLKTLLPEGHNAFSGTAYPQGGIGPPLTQQGNIGTGDHTALGIDDTKGAVRNLFQLDDHALKNTVGHFRVPP